MAESPREGDFGLKCIKDKKIPIGATVVVAGLLLAVIALAAKKCPPGPSCPDPAPLQCLENGIGFGGKCFYFLEEEEDWEGARNSCLSRRAHLAAVDTWEELNFLLRYGSSLHFWIGLRRDNSRPWEWYNGSLFSAPFEIQGSGECAYIESSGIGSDRCSRLKFSVCSHPQRRSQSSRTGNPGNAPGTRNST